MSPSLRVPDPIGVPMNPGGPHVPTPSGPPIPSPGGPPLPAPRTRCPHTANATPRCPPPRCPQVVNEGPSAISHGTLELSCPLALGDRPVLYIVGHSGPWNCSANHGLDRLQLAVRLWGRQWGGGGTGEQWGAMGGGCWGHWGALGGIGWHWVAVGNEEHRASWEGTAVSPGGGGDGTGGGTARSPTRPPPIGTAEPGQPRAAAPGHAGGGRSSRPPRSFGECPHPPPNPGLPPRVPSPSATRGRRRR